MIKNFGRLYELTVSAANEPPTPFEEVPEWVNGEGGVTPPPSYSGSSTIPAKSVTLTELNFKITVNKSTRQGSKSPTTQLKIYNMSENTRSLVETKGAYVVLKAGYNHQKDSLPVIFMGQVDNSLTEKEGHDIITTLFLKDASVPLDNQLVSVSFPPKTSVKEIVDTMALQFSGVGKGYLATDDLADLQELGGYSFSGSLNLILHKYLISYGYRYCIEDSSIFVYPARWVFPINRSGDAAQIDSQTIANAVSSHLPTLQNKAITFTPENALSIKKDRSSVTKKQTNTDNSTGVVIKTLLDGRIRLKNLLIKVEGIEKDQSLNGTYSIDSISHELQYEGGVWHTTLKATKVDNE